MMTTSLPIAKKPVAPLLAALEASGARAYKGRTFKVCPQKTYTINNGDLVRDGGSWDEVYFMSQQPGGKWEIVDARRWMKCAYTQGGQTETVEIPQNGVVAVHSFFTGKDCGYTFYVAPREDGAYLQGPPVAGLLGAAGHALLTAGAAK